MKHTFDLSPEPTFSTEEVIHYLWHFVIDESEYCELGDLILEEKRRYCLDDLYRIKTHFKSWHSRQLLEKLMSVKPTPIIYLPSSYISYETKAAL